VLSVYAPARVTISVPFEYGACFDHELKNVSGGGLLINQEQKLLNKPVLLEETKPLFDSLDGAGGCDKI
jgi:hypothetical protein